MPLSDPLVDQLARDGCLHLPSVLPATALPALAAQADRDAAARGAAGTRDLLQQPWCRELVPPLRHRLITLGLLQADAVAVQCTLFRKSAGANWKVGLHQDLSIPVAGPSDDPALSGWSLKQRVHFVQPPPALLEGLLAVRVHLDECGPGDGPLRVVPGSHRHGRLDAAAAAALRAAQGEAECLAQAGDALIMRPLLLHASSKALRPQGRRRVLHFLFGPGDPGHGLRWSCAI